MSDKMKEYIEKYAALQDMWNALYELEDQREKHHGLDLFEQKNLQDGFEAGQGVIANFPAADVVEVRHGRWIVCIDDPVGTVCSKCGFSWSRAINAVTLNPALSKIHTRYCPHCGAKMDGGADGGERKGGDE